ncbi:MAG: peptidase [Nitrospirae bacterium CG_4_10_14_0_8_um_filter_41_23]|nr:DegQ family serine endoprotease [Nitrospirota bacterium]PIQ93081.1 MAG: peptidase [Nitrospirae bacterium CG11_big_fil_rev_8_21_14_0_20_41_14]PIV43777.1 MAG: peptidase [Nitrospirae bacterium CG02_land_8_20_14_3_00_41_53]PIW87880.1 MAG: peptidase [Nitrospirae bacterium CG_4_8_14_3_um_filter_41_47]PIY86627.1 MAG: peptidase [Nitrospirae bacterium CG_4_10_14_0_8_um_filter_41_23]PJA80058.1 MAG: peptidase [Nitrospirae bacterium CG_4_9_14_3_um_filter_41_27]
MFLKQKRFCTITTFIRTWFILGLIFSLNFGAWSYTYASGSKISQQSIDILTQIGQATAEIAETVKPAIVNILTTRTIKIQGNTNPFLDDPFFRRFFGDRLRVPKERKTASLGSGVIVDSNGYILTTNHLIQGAEEINVTLSDKREFKGKIIGNDVMTDIGIIKIDADNLPTIKWGDSDKLRVGETVLAIGSPYGLSQTVTTGIVSAVGRANVGIADYEDFIQTDAAINPGNSGGALVNVRGELVGINTAIFTTSGGYQGIGFSIPTSMAKAVMDSLISKGKVIRGWLGVTIQPLTPELAKQFNLKEEKGALVGDVSEGSPAEKAGLQSGDVIIEYEGKKIEEPYQLRNMVANTPTGQEVELKIIRENKTETKKVTVSELPAEMQKPSKGEYNNLLRGVTVQDLLPEIYNKLNIPKKLKGVIVSDMDEDSPAARVLMQGDVIQGINRQKITSIKDYENMVSRINSDENILLLIYRGGSSLFITLSVK